MNIYEAVKTALKYNKKIKRKDIDFPITIMPTNTSIGYVVCIEGKAPARGWEPTANDLVSDEWAIV